MDDYTNTNPEIPQEVEQEQELSHSDKMMGIFTEPGATFEKTAKFPPKTIDWILPVLLLIVIAILSNVLTMSNPAIKYDMQQKQLEQMQKGFDDAVAKGQMTQEQADEQMNQMQDRMGSFGGAMMIFQYVSIFFVIFISFFIVTLVYYMVLKLAFKGDGNYASAMVANGLPYYIGIIQIIVMTILSLAFSKSFMGTSVAVFAGMEKGTFMNFLLGRIDVFTVWALIVTGIGLTKMFRLTGTGKIVGTVLAIWIVWGLLTWALASAVPFLSFLAQ